MDESNPSVWEMPGLFARVEVKWPLQREKADIFGHSFDGVYIRNEDDTVSYLLQHPDPEYKHIFEQTVESRNQRLKTTSRHLIHFESVDLKKPCPWWMELWVIRMLRLEHHEPPDVPGDEGYDRVATAPTPGGSTISTGGSEYGTTEFNQLELAHEDIPALGHRGRGYHLAKEQLLVSTTGSPTKGPPQ
ncbi:hypothetical protein FRC11_008719 [Ceratobasidium sp. 423]|nr:hypothetical protein FRC11_008719 [Ceratobasidium sp. 423]